MLYHRKNNAGIFCCFSLFLLLGYVHMIQHTDNQLRLETVAAKLRQSAQVSLLGRMKTMAECSQDKCRFDFEVYKLLIHDSNQQWADVDGTVRLTLHGSLNEQPGRLLLIRAKAGPITNFKTPGAFNYKGYMAAKNIFISGWIQDTQNILPVIDHTGEFLTSYRYLPERVRQQVARFISTNLSNDVAGIYQALLVGSRAGVSPLILEQFKATGTMHLLAISGLHMGLLGLMIGSILNWLLRRSEWLLLHTHVPGLALLGTLPVLLGYGFIAGMNTPVLRALVMSSILLFSIILRKHYDLLHLVAAAALFILVATPHALFTASFQLSFAAVTAMALFLPPIKSSPVAEDEPDRKRFLVVKYFRTALLISFAATAGTLPFMLYHFNRFSPIGPVMNLIIEPLLCFWALPLGIIAIPFMAIAPQLAIFLLKIGSMGIIASKQCSAIGASLPLSSIWTITPSPGEILAYGAILLAFLCRNKRPLNLLPIALASCILLVHFTMGIFLPSKPLTSQVTFLDVGQGNSTFLHLPDGSRILVDGGGGRNSSFNTGERIIAPYLWKQRIWRLDQAVITHPHSDHFNGMDFIIPHFRPQIVYVNGDDRGEGNYAEILKLARQTGADIRIPETGQILAQQKDYQLTVLGMNGILDKTRPSVNDRCLVLRYTHGRRSFFLPADISAESENCLLDNWQNLHSDVLLASHHGSATASSPSFIKAVSPSLIVVSAGKNGKKYYPAPKNIIAWKKQHIKTYITRNMGTITCTTNGNSLGCIPFTQKTQPKNNTDSK